jgi:hypothetical protein
MATHKLELLDNAIDSFNEALAKYQQAEAGENSAYKFAILHFAHFLELLFKHYVTKAHPLLIYKNPFSKKISREQTIGLWEAVQFLRNEGRAIDTKFEKDLEWLKGLRNAIEHHKFEMDLEEVQLTLGRLTLALQEFTSHVDEFDIAHHVKPENLSVFIALSDEYREAIIIAKRAAAAKAGADGVETCYDCFNETAVFLADEWVCQYCEAADQLVDCCVCGDELRQSLSILWNDDDPNDFAYICRGCRGRIADM